MPGLEDMKSGLAPANIKETDPEGRHENSPFVKSSNDSLGGDAGLEGNGIPKNGQANTTVSDNLAAKK
tara:strand:- start:1034 stop:1237 length:204 start_codon:yes stop_codon:yes gene_type:complete